MAMEIIDWPINHGDFPWLFVCLPDGKKSQGKSEMGLARNEISVGSFAGLHPARNGNQQK